MPFTYLSLMQFDKKQRLFILEIPEQQLYCPKTMIIILGHEIAHFVGTDIRNRDIRKNILFDIAASLILEGMIGYIEKNEIFSENIDEDGICTDLNEEINNLLCLYMERYTDKNFLSDKYPGKSQEVIDKNYKFIND